MRPNPLPLVIGLSALLNTLNHSGHQANTKAAPTDGLNWTAKKGAELESSPNYPLLAPVVEIEEDVYTYSNADNGAGPMWCSGSTCLVRSGEHLFASGLETVPDA